MPTFELVGTKFDQEGCGYCEYWIFLRKDYQNRLNFKLAVKNWYNKNKKDLVWISSNDCSGQHSNKGHYKLKKK